MLKLPAYASNNSVKAMALFTLGEEIESLAITNEFLNTSAQERPLQMAAIYAWRGEADPRYSIFLEKLGLLEAWKAMPKSAG
jgi:hypothetical protein